MTSRRRTMSNQHRNNVVYVNNEIYNVEKCRINVDINNIRQLSNNVVVLNVEFHNIDQRRNNVLNITMFKKLIKAKKYIFELQKKEELFH